MNIVKLLRIIVKFVWDELVIVFFLGKKKNIYEIIIYIFYSNILFSIFFLNW